MKYGNWTFKQLPAVLVSDEQDRNSKDSFSSATWLYLEIESQRESQRKEIYMFLQIFVCMIFLVFCMQMTLHNFVVFIQLEAWQFYLTKISSHIHANIVTKFDKLNYFSNKRDLHNKQLLNVLSMSIWKIYISNKVLNLCLISSSFLNSSLSINKSFLCFISRGWNFPNFWCLNNENKWKYTLLMSIMFLILEFMNSLNTYLYLYKTYANNIDLSNYLWLSIRHTYVKRHFWCISLFIFFLLIFIGILRHQLIRLCFYRGFCWINSMKPFLKWSSTI